MDFATLIREVLEANGNEIKFSETLRVKASPHRPMDRIISVLLIDGVILFETKDDDELRFLDESSEMVISSIYQRIRLMRFNKVIL